MDTLKISSIQPEIGVRASRAAPIIVGTDGKSQSDAALVMARVLSDVPEAVRLVTAVRPVPVFPDSPSSVNEDVEAARRAEAKHEALAQAERLWQDDSDVEVYDGDPALVLGKLAHLAGATLIVAGIGRHRVMDRVFGSETALRLIRVADCPVLAVANGANRAPRRIVVAVDFSETSLRAARLALDLAASGAVLYLAHVAPRDSSLYGWADHSGSYKQDAGDALQRVREQLHVPESITVQKVLLQGDATTELLAFATSVNADLIATGSHGHGFVTRMLIGSVTTRLVRLSTCSVLTVPHGAVMTRARVGRASQRRQAAACRVGRGARDILAPERRSTWHARGRRPGHRGAGAGVRLSADGRRVRCARSARAVDVRRPWRQNVPPHSEHQCGDVD